MRVLIATCALLLGTATAFSRDFRIDELATYSGNIPCADCVGIRYVLSLRPDGRFYRQRTYLHSDSAGQVVLDLGVWSVTSSVLTLVTTTHESETFTVSSAQSLLLLDRDGVRDACTGQSDLNCTLARQRPAYVPPGLYLIRGVYREAGGRRTLQPCGSNTRLPAETTGRPLLLERLSKAAAGGKPVLVTVTGLLDTRSAGPASESLRIASVLTTQPGGACTPLTRIPMVAALDTPAVPSAGPRPEQSDPLAGTSWVLTRIGGEAPPAGVGEGEASLRFLQGGRASGFTGCNRFNGAYTLAGRSVRFGLNIVTRMACPVSVNIEIPYLKALQDARQIDLNGDSLYLLGEASRRIAEFRAVR